MMVLAHSSPKETLTTIRPTIKMSLIYWMMVHQRKEASNIETTIEVVSETETIIEVVSNTEEETETTIEVVSNTEVETETTIEVVSNTEVETETTIEVVSNTEVETETTIEEVSIEIKINLIISESSKTIKMKKLICLTMNPTY